MDSVAFTGHRPSYFSFGYDEEASLCVDIKRALLSQIMLLYRNGIRKYYTGCAMGVDLWAAELVLGLMKRKDFADIQLYCCIPFEDQAARWSVEMRNRYYAMLERSTDNILLQTHFSSDCFYKRNRYMVDQCNYLLAVYDVLEQHKSGTGYMVKYAQSLNRGIIYINPSTAKVTELTVIDAPFVPIN